MNPLTSEIIADAHSHYDAKRATALKRYFREPIQSWGLPMPLCREIASHFYPKVRENLPQAMEVTGELHEHGIIEIVTIGDYMLTRMKKQITPEHFDVFDSWVDTLTNWANTDEMCTNLVAETIRKEPKLVEKLLIWTDSDNRWRRRAAAVSLVPIARNGEKREEVFRIADRLIEDRDDVVQKGVGWLLK